MEKKNYISSLSGGNLVNPNKVNFPFVFFLTFCYSWYVSDLSVSVSKLSRSLNCVRSVVKLHLFPRPVGALWHDVTSRMRVWISFFFIDNNEWVIPYVCIVAKDFNNTHWDLPSSVKHCLLGDRWNLAYEEQSPFRTDRLRGFV